MINTELLSKLCSIYGPSGNEEEIAEFILNEIKEYIDEYEFDSLGNLIAHKKGTGKKMMLAGHMDQIGLMVTYIDDEGFLRFSNIGGISPYSSLTQRVIFKNGTTGVIGCERLDDVKNEFAIDKLYIDIGASNKEDAEKKVSVGDVCVYHQEPVIDSEKIISKALDDRVGCFIMIEALKKMQNPAFDLYFVFTVQEEVGLRGAKTSSFSVDPDYGLAFDVTTSNDTPNTKNYPSKMHGGAAIKLKDRSVICHPAMVKHLTKCAEKNNIKHQFEILDMGGTDIGAIHMNKSGVPSGAISVASRYIHSTSEMCSLSDVEDCIKLTVCVLENEIEL